MTQEIFDKIEVLYESFKAEHAGTSKAAHGRARKALGNIKNLFQNIEKHL